MRLGNEVMSTSQNPMGVGYLVCSNIPLVALCDGNSHGGN